MNQLPNKLSLYLIVITIFSVILFAFSEFMKSNNNFPIIYIIPVIIVLFIFFLLANKKLKDLRVNDNKRRKEIGLKENYVDIDEALKFSEEGIQIENKFLNWSKVKKVSSKGIIRARYLFGDGFGLSVLHPRMPDCHYFIRISDNNGKKLKLLFEVRGYWDKNPLTVLKNRLKNFDKLNILEEQGKEWVKGNDQIREKLNNPFND